MNDPAVTCTIDLTAPGKQIGRLQFPKISNTAGWAYDFVPIATIGNGEGPTVLVSGGNHGLGGAVRECPGAAGANAKSVDLARRGPLEGSCVRQGGARTSGAHRARFSRR